MVTQVGYLLRKSSQSLMSRALKDRYIKKFPQTNVGREAPDLPAIRRRLAELGVTVNEAQVDANTFNAWVAAAHYSPLAYAVNRTEKFLEHYISFELMAAREGSTIVDVASCRSQFPKILRGRGYRVIAQDLSYPPGLEGDQLGGSADDLALADASVGGMTLHCSFEHFEGSADSGFVREVARVLEPGARAVIVPLYVHQRYLIETDPHVTEPLDNPDPGAEVVFAFGYANRHGRHYSPDALKTRVIDVALSHALIPTVFHFTNVRDISPSCYANFALVLEKPKQS